jgi:hypothetical protein
MFPKILYLPFPLILIVEKMKEFEEISLSVPLSNILTSADDFRLASHKVDEVEQMITEQEMEDYSQWYAHVTSWSAIINCVVFIVFACCCWCCC